MAQQFGGFDKSAQSFDRSSGWAANLGGKAADFNRLYADVVSENENLNQSNKAVGRDRWDKSSQQEMNELDKLFSLAGEVGERALDVASLGLSDYVSDRDNNIVLRGLASIPQSVLGMPFVPLSGAQSLYEATTGRPVAEGSFETGEMPDYELSAEQRAGAAVSGAVDTAGTLFGGSGRMIKAGAGLASRKLGSGKLSDTIDNMSMLDQISPNMKTWQKNVARVAGDSLEEAREEFVQSYADDARYQALGEDSFGKAAESAFLGAVGGAAMSGVGVGMDNLARKAEQANSRTSLDNQQPGLTAFNFDPLTDNPLTERAAEYYESQNADKDAGRGGGYATIAPTTDNSLGIDDFGLGVENIRATWIESDDAAKQWIASKFGATEENMNTFISDLEKMILSRDIQSLQSLLNASANRRMTIGRQPAMSGTFRIDGYLSKIYDGSGIWTNQISSQLSNADIDGDLRSYIADAADEGVPAMLMSERLVSRLEEGSTDFKWQYFPQLDSKRGKNELRKIINEGIGKAYNLDSALVEEIISAMSADNETRQASNAIGIALNKLRNIIYYSEGESSEKASAVLSQFLKQVQNRTLQEDYVTSYLDEKFGEANARAEEQSKAFNEEHEVEVKSTGITKTGTFDNFFSVAELASVLNMITSYVQAQEGSIFRESAIYKYMSTKPEYFNKWGNILSSESSLDQFFLSNYQIENIGQEYIQSANAAFSFAVYVKVATHPDVKLGQIGAPSGAKGTSIKDFEDVFTEAYNECAKVFNKAFPEELTTGESSPLFGSTDVTKTMITSENIHKKINDVFGQYQMKSIFYEDVEGQYGMQTLSDFVSDNGTRRVADREHTSSGALDSLFIKLRDAEIKADESNESKMIKLITKESHTYTEQELADPNNRDSVKWLVNTITRIMDPSVIDVCGLDSADNALSFEPFVTYATTHDQELKKDIIETISLFSKYNPTLRAIIEYKYNDKFDRITQEEAQIKVMNSLANITHKSNDLMTKQIMAQFDSDFDAACNMLINLIGIEIDESIVSSEEGQPFRFVHRSHAERKAMFEAFEKTGFKINNLFYHIVKPLSNDTGVNTIGRNIRLAQASADTEFKLLDSSRRDRAKPLVEMMRALPNGNKKDFLQELKSAVTSLHHEIDSDSFCNAIAGYGWLHQKAAEKGTIVEAAASIHSQLANRFQGGDYSVQDQLDLSQRQITDAQFSRNKLLHLRILFNNESFTIVKNDGSTIDLNCRKYFMMTTKDNNPDRSYFEWNSAGEIIGLSTDGYARLLEVKPAIIDILEPSVTRSIDGQNKEYTSQSLHSIMQTYYGNNAVTPSDVERSTPEQLKKRAEMNNFAFEMMNDPQFHSLAAYNMGNIHGKTQKEIYGLAKNAYASTLNDLYDSIANQVNLDASLKARGLDQLKQRIAQLRDMESERRAGGNPGTKAKSTWSSVFENIFLEGTSLKFEAQLMAGEELENVLSSFFAEFKAAGSVPDLDPSHPLYRIIDQRVESYLSSTDVQQSVDMIDSLSLAMAGESDMFKYFGSELARRLEGNYYSADLLDMINEQIIDPMEKMFQEMVTEYKSTTTDSPVDHPVYQFEMFHNRPELMNKINDALRVARFNAGKSNSTLSQDDEIALVLNLLESDNTYKDLQALMRRKKYDEDLVVDYWDSIAKNLIKLESKPEDASARISLEQARIRANSLRFTEDLNRFNIHYKADLENNMFSDMVDTLSFIQDKIANKDILQERGITFNYANQDRFADSYFKEMSFDDSAKNFIALQARFAAGTSSIKNGVGINGSMPLMYEGIAFLKNNESCKTPPTDFSSFVDDNTSYSDFFIKIGEEHDMLKANQVRAKAKLKKSESFLSCYISDQTDAKLAMQEKSRPLNPQTYIEYQNLKKTNPNLRLFIENPAECTCGVCLKHSGNSYIAGDKRHANRFADAIYKLTDTTQEGMYLKLKKALDKAGNNLVESLDDILGRKINGDIVNALDKKSVMTAFNSFRNELFDIYVSNNKKLDMKLTTDEIWSLVSMNTVTFKVQYSDGSYGYEYADTLLAYLDGGEVDPESKVRYESIQSIQPCYTSVKTISNRVINAIVKDGRVDLIDINPSQLELAQDIAWKAFTDWSDVTVDKGDLSFMYHIERKSRGVHSILRNQSTESSHLKFLAANKYSTSSSRTKALPKLTDKQASEANCIQTGNGYITRVVVDKNFSNTLSDADPFKRIANSDENNRGVSIYNASTFAVYETDNADKVNRLLRGRANLSKDLARYDAVLIPADATNGIDDKFRVDTRVDINGKQYVPYKINVDESEYLVWDTVGFDPNKVGVHLCLDRNIPMVLQDSVAYASRDFLEQHMEYRQEKIVVTAPWKEFVLVNKKSMLLDITPDNIVLPPDSTKDKTSIPGLLEDYIAKISSSNSAYPAQYTKGDIICFIKRNDKYMPIFADEAVGRTFELIGDEKSKIVINELSQIEFTISYENTWDVLNPNEKAGILRTAYKTQVGEIPSDVDEKIKTGIAGNRKTIIDGFSSGSRISQYENTFYNNMYVLSRLMPSSLRYKKVGNKWVDNDHLSSWATSEIELGGKRTRRIDAMFEERYTNHPLWDDIANGQTLFAADDNMSPEDKLYIKTLNDSIRDIVAYCDDGLILANFFESAYITHDAFGNLVEHQPIKDTWTEPNQAIGILSKIGEARAQNLFHAMSQSVIARFDKATDNEYLDSTGKFKTEMYGRTYYIPAFIGELAPWMKGTEHVKEIARAEMSYQENIRDAIVNGLNARNYRSVLNHAVGRVSTNDLRVQIKNKHTAQSYKIDSNFIDQVNAGDYSVRAKTLSENWAFKQYINVLNESDRKKPRYPIHLKIGEEVLDFNTYRTNDKFIQAKQSFMKLLAPGVTFSDLDFILLVQDSMGWSHNNDDGTQSITINEVFSEVAAWTQNIKGHTKGTPKWFLDPTNNVANNRVRMGSSDLAIMKQLYHKCPTYNTTMSEAEFLNMAVEMQKKTFEEIDKLTRPASGKAIAQITSQQEALGIQADAIYRSLTGEIDPVHLARKIDMSEFRKNVFSTLDFMLGDEDAESRKLAREEYSRGIEQTKNAMRHFVSQEVVEANDALAISGKVIQAKYDSASYVERAAQRVQWLTSLMTLISPYIKVGNFLDSGSKTTLAVLQQRHSGLFRQRSFQDSILSDPVKYDEIMRLVKSNKQMHDIFKYLTTARMMNFDDELLAGFSAGMDINEFIQSVYNRNDSKWKQRFDKALEWCTTSKTLIPMQIEVWMYDFCGRVSTSEAAKRELMFALGEDANGDPITLLETLLKNDPVKLMNIVLETGSPARSVALASLNFANRHNMARETCISLVTKELLKRHPAASLLNTVFGSPFYRYATNVTLNIASIFLPMSSINYIASTMLQGKSIMGVDMDAVGVEQTRLYASMKAAVAADITRMSVPVIACCLVAISGALEPPEDEDEWTDYRNWTFFGMRIAPQWWIMDMLGLTLPLACFMKTCMEGKPRFDVLLNGAGSVLSSNPMMSLGSVVDTIANPEGSLQTWEDEQLKYADTVHKAPTELDAILAMAFDIGATGLSRVFIPNIVEQVFNAYDYEVSYRRVHGEGVDNIDPQNLETGDTTEVDYLEAQIRKITRHNPVIGFMCDIVTPGERTSYIATGNPLLNKLAMPIVEYYSQYELDFMTKYSIFTEDGAEKSEVEKNKAALDIIATLESYSSPAELANSSFALDYDTRVYVSQFLRTAIEDNNDSFYEWFNSDGADAYTLGGGDYQAGQRVRSQAYEEKDQYNDYLYALNDLLWDDSIPTTLTTYAREHTTYRADNRGNIEASGFNNYTNLFLPFVYADGTTTDPQGTMGYDYSYETQDVRTGQSTGQRALKPLIEDVSKLETTSTLPEGSTWFDSDDNYYGKKYGSSNGSGSSSRSGYRSSGGGSGYSPSIYSRPGSLNIQGPSTYQGSRLYDAQFDYLRPGYETKGSREAYKRGDF